MFIARMQRLRAQLGLDDYPLLGSNDYSRGDMQFRGELSYEELLNLDRRNKHRGSNKKEIQERTVTR